MSTGNRGTEKLHSVPASRHADISEVQIHRYAGSQKINGLVGAARLQGDLDALIDRAQDGAHEVTGRAMLNCALLWRLPIVILSFGYESRLPPQRCGCS